MSALVLAIFTGVLIMSFALYVENLFELYIKDIGHELTKSNNKSVICIISFIPIVNIGLFLFYLVKYLVYVLDRKDKE